VNRFEPDSDPVALKVIDANKMDSAARKMLADETEIMTRLDHPNINRFLQIIIGETYTKKNGG
jgi:hypothetical protein